MDTRNDYDFGSHLLHCRERNIKVHVTGETPKLIKRRWRRAGEILARYVQTGELPDALPQGIVIVVTDTVNHGDGGP